MKKQAVQNYVRGMTARPSAGGLLQRQCSCGGSTGLTGSCMECEKKKLVGQPLQTKLRISEPGDPYEQEADRAAEQVMRMPEPVRGQSHGEPARGPLVQRRMNGLSGGEAGVTPPIVQDVLLSPGQPLDAYTRAFFEPRFAHDLGQVRIHADTQAARSAQAVNALAYTVGRDVVFSAGTYAPRAPRGQRLLAHELSHVIQQGSSSSGSMLRRAPGAGAESEKAPAPLSLSTGIASTHEIVVDGEPFDVVVMSSESSPHDSSSRYRKTADEYLGSYPNLGSGFWAFLVRQADGVFCQIGGNCLGWAYGTYGLNDPPERVWGLSKQYLESIGRLVRGDKSPQETYFKQARKEAFPASAMWDYFMNIEFQAVPTESDGGAHLALYGRGFGGPSDGPTHIAFRTAGGELWVSKPSPSRFPLVHEQASQMSGGQTGEVVRLYTRASGPPSHVVLRAKQAQPSQ